MQPKKLVCDLGNVINNSRSVMSQLDITRPKTTFPIEFAGAIFKIGSGFQDRNAIGNSDRKLKTCGSDFQDSFNFQCIQKKIFENKNRAYELSMILQYNTVKIHLQIVSAF